MRSDFQFRYNALFNVDQELVKIYQVLLKRKIEMGDYSIVSKPERQDSSKTKEIIRHLQDLLTSQPSDAVRSEIYYRIALSYFLEENYHTALSYLELLEEGFNSVESQILKAQCYLFMDQHLEACKVIGQIINLKRTKKDKAHIAAFKAEIFSRQNKQDSALYYLEEAISYKISREYQPIWKLQLGKWYAGDRADRADFYLKKIAHSNSVDSRLKLEAHLQRVLLHKYAAKDRIAAANKLLQKGFTINNEWQIYAFIAKEFSRMEQVDSAIRNYEKVLNHPFSPSSVKDVTKWELANLYMDQQQFQQVIHYLEQLDAENLKLTPKEALLLHNKSHWLALLENTKLQDSAFFHHELADLYRSLGIEDTTLDEISETSDHEATMLNTWYEKMYVLYNESKYAELIAESNVFLQSVSSPRWRSKVAYLRALAIGHSQPIDSLIQALNKVTTDFKGNSAVLKRVKAHLNFIQENESYYLRKNPVLEKPKESGNFTLPQAEQEGTVIALATLNNGTLIDDLHTTNEPYYYVILVKNARENLTPTRYSIGQFIRTRFPSKEYRHALKPWDNECQFIYVGDFSSFEECEAFQISIEKLLPEIIKVREKKYSTFVIPKKELDTMEDISSINKYLKK